MTIHAKLGNCTVKYNFNQETQDHLDSEVQRTGKTIEEIAAIHVGLKIQSVKRNQPNHPPGVETF